MESTTIMMNSTMENTTMIMNSTVDAETDVSDDRFWLTKLFYAGILYHTIPGVAFMLGGSAYLFLLLIRARALRLGQSFCATYIPERDYQMIRIVSTWTLVGILFLAVRQVTGPCFDPGNTSFFCFLNQPGHVSMYGSYASIAIVALLECSGRVPADSWRCAVVLCSLMNSFLMTGHAPMKPTPEDQLTHSLWGDLELYHAMITLYSIYDTSNLPAYLATFIMLIVKGFWITMAGIQLQTHVMIMENIRPTLVLLILFVTGATTLVGAFYGNVHYQHDLSIRSDASHYFKEQKSLSSNDDGVYKHLKSQYGDEGDDDCDGNNKENPFTNEI